MPEVRTTSSTGGEKGVKEARFDLIPAGPLLELATHYGRGALKYDSHQWRNGYEWEKSGAAIDRHTNWWRRGFDYDVCSNEPEGCMHEKDGVPWTELTSTPDTCYNHTGSHHMAAVAWHAFLLLEFKDTHPQHDNRYKRMVDFDIDYNHIAMPIFDKGPLYQKPLDTDQHDFEVLSRYLVTTHCTLHDAGQAGDKHVYFDGPAMTPKICNPKWGT